MYKQTLAEINNHKFSHFKLNIHSKERKRHGSTVYPLHIMEVKLTILKKYH